MTAVLEQDRTDVVKHGASGHGINLKANGVLHPCIRGQDEPRRQHGPERNDVDRGEVKFFGQAIPAKDPQSQERGFQEERQEAFHGERGTEDITHITAVVAQFIPNWNSCTMPVTTPMAKLIKNNLPKNLVA